ncbi:MAG: hypothetical protein HY898_15070 [Deltaproteobacteria bacterium]|nr:hypothetical protein [Deltaproteobacteria bacterium]
MSRLHTAVLASAAVAALSPAAAQAASPRPLFEPTDLELEDPGTFQLDTQLGVLRAMDSTKTVLPDLELDIGLSRNVELDLDGQYAIEGPSSRGFDWSRPGPDNLWLASKIGLLDWRDSARNRAWALGMQMGPKIPFARDTKGAGFEGLVLFGRSWGDAHVVLNLGALIDPGLEVSRGRPAGIEGGVDVSLPIGGRTALTFLGEVGGVKFVSRDPHQLHVTAGLSWAATKSTDVSLIGLKGLLSGGDRYGALLGLAQKFSLFE